MGPCEVASRMVVRRTGKLGESLTHDLYSCTIVNLRWMRSERMLLLIAPRPRRESETNFGAAGYIHRATLPEAVAMGLMANPGEGAESDALRCWSCNVSKDGVSHNLCHHSFRCMEYGGAKREGGVLKTAALVTRSLQSVKRAPIWPELRPPLGYCVHFSAMRVLCRLGPQRCAILSRCSDACEERLLYIPSAGFLLAAVGIGHSAATSRGASSLWYLLPLVAGAAACWRCALRVPDWANAQAITVADGERWGARGVGARNFNRSRGAPGLPHVLVRGGLGAGGTRLHRPRTWARLLAWRRFVRGPPWGPAGCGALGASTLFSRWTCRAARCACVAAVVPMVPGPSSGGLACPLRFSPREPPLRCAGGVRRGGRIGHTVGRGLAGVCGGPLRLRRAAVGRVARPSPPSSRSSFPPRGRWARVRWPPRARRPQAGG